MLGRAEEQMRPGRGAGGSHAAAAGLSRGQPAAVCADVRAALQQQSGAPVQHDQHTGDRDAAAPGVQPGSREEMQPGETDRENNPSDSYLYSTDPDPA